MKITIKNCNSIDEAEIVIDPGKLNIKYGSNGTGKSTVAKAIELHLTLGGDLSALTPFKLKDKQDDPTFHPAIVGADAFTSISVFNDDYISQFVFKQDEIVQDSFNIFIKTPDYEQKMEEIEKLIVDIKNTFKNNEELDAIAKDLSDLSESFGKSQSGYSKAGRIGKGIGNGNKIENIPLGLEGYSNFIKSSSNVKWIRWQIEGNNYSEISSDCPYCTSPTADKKETILSVSKEYDAKSIEHLNILCGIIERLGKYFSKDTITNVEGILKNKTGLKKEEVNYLTGIKDQIDTLREKLNDMKGISFFSLKDVGKVVEKIESLKINLDLLPCLTSEDTTKVVTAINQSLELVGAKAGKLQGEINKQKDGIEKTIQKHKKEINEFLRYAGYKYNIDIENVNDSYKMKLRHYDSKENIDDGAVHLSFGEKNAFALVLFMYENLAKKPDLIVLDDPISSFDRNKKFAIIEKLFRGKESFQGKTVLMLTHDIEPIIDIVKCLSHTFNPSPTAFFLKSQSGVLSEIEIKRDDILSFSQVCRENVAEHGEDVIKLIYLRRYYEIIDDKGFEYHMISSLFKKRADPTIRSAGIERVMVKAELDSASAGIMSWLPGFDYGSLLNVLNDNLYMTKTYSSTANNYERLQLFRIISTENHDNDVIKKFINETFHIENEYVMQLNPHKYDFVPEYIVSECDHVILAI